MRATYSPDDNKVRIYPDAMLPSDIYARLKTAGFKWAPKQGLFVAPMWTPQRVDLAEELCGALEDEDTSLVERAEERADRFDEYSDKRAREARQARDAVAEISGGIPMGQPILVGHHSQRRAEKDAKRIESGMQKAVKLWETSDYWTQRAAGALGHAKYKELPAVRARRIKTIEADKRKAERNRADHVMRLAFWNRSSISLNEATNFSNIHEIGGVTLDNGEKCWSVWSALVDGKATVEYVAERKRRSIPQAIEWNDRWIEHYKNRLAYERAMLEEHGASHLLAKKERPKPMPICNYMVADGLDIPSRYRRGEIDHYPMAVMTKAEYSAINGDYRGTRIVGNSHRVRTAMIRRGSDRNATLYAVFLSDSKTHEPPAAVDIELPMQPAHLPVYAQQPKSKDEQEFDVIRTQLKAGVQVVAAPQLFPTPAHIAAQMVELAEIEDEHRVLEPSAGTGNLLQAIMNDGKLGHVIAVEINQTLADMLSKEYPLAHVHCMDFLRYERGNYPVDRIVMNPPFGNAADIEHIQHALTMLAPGGRLVALCANGPRQQAVLKPMADYWEDLPTGSFQHSGTMVNVALMVIKEKEMCK